MEKRLSYIVVGAFVIILSISLLSFVYWLAKYGNDAVKHDYYHTYFKESVSGLNVESLVKLRGVEVGRVKKISINKENSEEVEVLLEIISGTPIKEDTFTVLDSQGITGLKYIELKGGHKNSQSLVTSEEKIATIQSRKSMLSSLFDNSESITVKVNTILNKVDDMLSDNNRKSVSNILSNVQTTTNYLNEAEPQLNKVFVEINDFLKHTQEFENSLIPHVRRISSMSDRAGEASESTKKFFNQMGEEVKKGHFDFSRIAKDNLQILNETALSVRDMSIKLDALVESLKESPSDILYKSNKKILGPGERND